MRVWLGIKGCNLEQLPGRDPVTPGRTASADTNSAVVASYCCKFLRPHPGKSRAAAVPGSPTWTRAAARSGPNPQRPRQPPYLAIIPRTSGSALPGFSPGFSVGYREGRVLVPGCLLLVLNASRALSRSGRRRLGRSLPFPPRGDPG